LRTPLVHSIVGRRQMASAASYYIWSHFIYHVVVNIITIVHIS